MQKTDYRELTLAAIVLGVLQGVVLNLAFVYAALKLGFSIGGSTVAAIMGYALLRGVMKKGTRVDCGNGNCLHFTGPFHVECYVGEVWRKSCAV